MIEIFTWLNYQISS